MSGAHRALYLAYGGLYALGGYAAWWTLRTSRPLWLALALAVVLCSAVGLLTHWWLDRHSSSRSEMSRLLTGLGLLVCLEELYRLGIGPAHLKVAAFGAHRIHHLGPLMVSDAHWLVFGVTFALLVVVHGLLTVSRPGPAFHTRLRGKALPSIAPASSRWLACGLGACLAGISGVLAAVYLNDVHPAMGTAITHKLLALVLIGSLGSLQGAAVAAFALALIEGTLIPATQLSLPPEAILLLTLALACGLQPAAKRGWRGTERG